MPRPQPFPYTLPLTEAERSALSQILELEAIQTGDNRKAGACRRLVRRVDALAPMHEEAPS